jgi:hypothetical protein
MYDHDHDGPSNIYKMVPITLIQGSLTSTMTDLSQKCLETCQYVLYSYLEICHIENYSRYITHRISLFIAKFKVFSSRKGVRRAIVVVIVW